MAQAPSGLHQLLLAREIGVSGPQESAPYKRSFHFPVHYAGKLSVAHTYNGHNGCVNRLSWNSDGTLLLSGSDDRRAIIWHHPEVERTPLALSTEHRANIFGVQFLPCTGDRRVVTGAMDDTVQLHDLEASPATHIPRSGSAGGGGRAQQPPIHRRVAASAHLQSVMPRTKVYFSHKDRVKDVRVEPMNPHNFWSGGEDGVVRQYDTRQPNQDKWESPTVLVQLRDGHKTIQVKSLDINKAHPHLLAVAGSDPHIRLYDRRKLGTGGWQRRGATPPVMALAPPHLPLAAAARHGRSHATYVAFSNRGDKLVTTYHADHAYCFDITSGGDLSALFPDPAAALGVGTGAAAPPAAGGVSGLVLPLRQQSATPPSRGEAGGSGDSAALRGIGGGGSSGSGSSSPLPPRADEAKARGNTCMFERKWTAAVVAFTDALHWAPGAAVLYGQRAEALLGRGWVGDAAMALRDCDTAIGLDEGFGRAYLRRIHALQALQQFQCALTAVDEYQRRFPGRAADDVTTLVVSLRAAVEERRRLYEARRQQQERRRAQRAAALARVQGRVDSPARPMPGGASAAGSRGAGASAAAAAETAATAVAETAAAAAAAVSAAATSAGGGAGAGSSTEDAEMEDSEVYGPPPPPYESAEEGDDDDDDDREAASGGAVSAPMAAEGPAGAALESSSRGQGLEASQLEEGIAEQATSARPAAASPASVGQAARAGSSAPASAGGLAHTAEAAQLSDRQAPQEPAGEAAAGEPQGRSVPGARCGATAATAAPSGSSGGGGGGGGAAAAEEAGGHARAGSAAPAGPSGTSGAGDGAEATTAEAAVEAARASGPGRPPETASDGDGPARRFLRSEEEEEDEDEDEDEAPDEGEDEGDTTDVESLPGEEDPDMELFLQYYSRVMDIAGASGSGGAGASASARHGGYPGDPGTSTSSAAAAGGCSGGGAGPGGRRIRGAWDGTPGGRRMLQRYVGQCNVQTDIKEVGFLGSDDSVVAAGSDCGRVFLYDAASGAVLRALPADEDVANCVQCHPSLPVIATSGIETVVRLWAPTDALPSPAAVRELAEELDAVVGRNQERMKEGPSMLRASALQQALQENPQLWQLLMSQLYGRGVMGARGRPGGGGAGAAAGPAAGGGEEPGGDDDDDDEGHPEVSCRMA